MRGRRDWWLGLVLIGCGGGGAHGAASPEPSPPGAATTSPTEADSPRTAQLRSAYADGRFSEVLDGCPTRDDKSAPRDTLAWCMALVPASLHALGRHPDALLRMKEICAVMPPAGPKNEGRALYLGMIMFMLTEAHEAGHFQSESAERKALLESWLDICQVPLEQVEQTIQNAQLRVE